MFNIAFIIISSFFLFCCVLSIVTLMILTNAYFLAIAWKIITVRDEIFQLTKHFFPLGKCSQLSFGHFWVMRDFKNPYHWNYNASSVLEEI